MKIHQREKNGVNLLEVDGEIDFHSSPQLREQLHQLIDKEGCKLIINLKKVSYIDSSGLATFVEALQRVNRNQGSLIISDLTTPVRSVFEIAKLETIFTLLGSEDEALGVLTK
ncbi:MAG: STAS domain-containing protein [Candidatus Omnitrophota bacterium]|nr:STAS domain-containing protein [Candidatus Omnitrophota bacterium]